MRVMRKFLGDYNANQLATLEARAHNILRDAVLTNFGFLDRDQLAVVAGNESTQRTEVLIRFEEGRVKCAAEMAHDVITKLEAQGWSVRDVCVPLESPLPTQFYRNTDAEGR